MRKDQYIYTILKNTELILCLCESNPPRSRVHTSKEPRAFVYAKINEAWYDYILATSNYIIFPMGPHNWYPMLFWLTKTKTKIYFHMLYLLLVTKTKTN